MVELFIKFGLCLPQGDCLFGIRLGDGLSCHTGLQQVMHFIAAGCLQLAVRNLVFLGFSAQEVSCLFKAHTADCAVLRIKRPARFIHTGELAVQRDQFFSGLACLERFLIRQLFRRALVLFEEFLLRFFGGRKLLLLHTVFHFLLPQAFGSRLNAKISGILIHSRRMGKDLIDIVGLFPDEVSCVLLFLRPCAQHTQTVRVDSDPGDHFLRDALLGSAVLLDPLDEITLIVLHPVTAFFQISVQGFDAFLHGVDTAFELRLFLFAFRSAALQFFAVGFIFAIGFAVFTSAHESEDDHRKTCRCDHSHCREQDHSHYAAGDQCDHAQHDQQGAGSLCRFGNRCQIIILDLIELQQLGIEIVGFDLFGIDLLCITVLFRLFAHDAAVDGLHLFSFARFRQRILVCLKKSFFLFRDPVAVKRLLLEADGLFESLHLAELLQIRFDLVRMIVGIVIQDLLDCGSLLGEASVLCLQGFPLIRFLLQHRLQHVFLMLEILLSGREFIEFRNHRSGRFRIIFLQAVKLRLALIDFPVQRRKSCLGVFPGFLLVGKRLRVGILHPDHVPHCRFRRNDAFQRFGIQMIRIRGCLDFLVSFRNRLLLRSGFLIRIGAPETLQLAGHLIDPVEYSRIGDLSLIAVGDFMICGGIRTACAFKIRNAGRQFFRPADPLPVLIDHGIFRNCSSKLLAHHILFFLQNSDLTVYFLQLAAGSFKLPAVLDRTVIVSPVFFNPAAHFIQLACDITESCACSFLFPRFTLKQVALVLFLRDLTVQAVDPAAAIICFIYALLLAEAGNRRLIGSRVVRPRDQAVETVLNAFGAACALCQVLVDEDDPLECAGIQLEQLFAKRSGRNAHRLSGIHIDDLDTVGALILTEGALHAVAHALGFKLQGAAVDAALPGVIALALILRDIS